MKSSVKCPVNEKSPQYQILLNHFEALALEVD